MEGIWNDEVSRSLDTFEDHLRWKFGSICSDGKNDSEAAFFCSAGPNRNCSAASKLEGMRATSKLFSTASASATILSLKAILYDERQAFGTMNVVRSIDY